MSQERRWMALGVIASPALVGLLAGCASDKVTGPGALRETWSTQLEQYGIYAVFPPRADIQVGDIYLTCASLIEQKFAKSNETARRMVPTPIWVASVPGMLDHGSTDGYLSALYKTRVQLPRLPVAADAAGEAPAPAAASTVVKTSAAATASKRTAEQGAKTPRATHAKADTAPVDAPAESIFRSRPLATVMPVSLPEFFSAAGTKADAEAIVPLPTILANLGVHASEVDAVQISVPSAESYGLPAATMMKALADWTAKKPADRTEVASVRQIGLPLRNQTAARQWCAMGMPQYMVVTEIFATRSINVSMSFSSSAGVGAGVGLNLPTGSKNAAVWDALSQYFVPQKPGASTTGGAGSTGGSDPKAGTAGGGTAQATPPTIDQATAFIKELNALYAKMGGEQTLSYPGGQVTVVTANSAGVSMNRKFEVPVVIGYRGMPMPLEAFDPFVKTDDAVPDKGARTNTAATNTSPTPILDVVSNPNSPLSIVHKGIFSDNAQRTIAPVKLVIQKD